MDLVSELSTNTQGIGVPPVNLETTAFEGIIILSCNIKNIKPINLKPDEDGSNQ